jgi:hypothetical protein
MNLQEVERDLLQLIAECGDIGVPSDQLTEMASLATAGEPGVALENLCTQLFEYDASIPPSALQRMRRLGEAMGVNPAHWERLSQR